MELRKAADPACRAWAVPQDGLLGGEGSAGQMKRRQQVQEGAGEGPRTGKCQAGGVLELQKAHSGLIPNFVLSAIKGTALFCFVLFFL